MFNRDTNPAHWKLLIFYYNPDEPRLLVPKRITGLPFTLNFAHPAAWPITAVVVGLIVFAAIANNRF